MPQTNLQYAYAESLGYSHRLLRIEQRFVLFASISAYLLEELGRLTLNPIDVIGLL